jgi:hypothetical protein
MKKISIFQFTMYDIMSDTTRLSRRYGTIEAIQNIGGAAVLDSRVEIDTSKLVSDIDGFTVKDFQPISIAE